MFFGLKLKLNFSFTIFVFKAHMYYLAILFKVIRKKNWHNLRKLFLQPCTLWKRQQNPHITELWSCILNMLCVIDLSLILFNTSCGIYSVLKKSNYTAVSLSINNETQCVPLFCLSLRFITYALSVILSSSCCCDYFSRNSFDH